MCVCVCVYMYVCMHACIHTTMLKRVCTCVRTYILTYIHTYIRKAVKKFPEFFDTDGLLHHEFVPPGQSLAGHFYVQVLQRLRDAVWRKRGGMWQGHWFLHHDNAPSHFCHHPTTVLSEPISKWFSLFPTLKKGLKGAYFTTMEGIKSNAKATLRNIPNEAFRRCVSVPYVLALQHNTTIQETIRLPNIYIYMKRRERERVCVRACARTC
jgi:hypothetical protein